MSGGRVGTGARPEINPGPVAPGSVAGRLDASGGCWVLACGPLGGAALCAVRRRPSALPRRANGCRRCQVAAEARLGAGMERGRAAAGRVAPSRDLGLRRAVSEIMPVCSCLCPGRGNPTCRSVVKPPASFWLGSGFPGGQRRGRAWQSAEVWAAAAVIAVGLLSSRYSAPGLNNKKIRPVDLEGRW